MQYLKVRFPTRRRIKIDGEFNGYTNKLIEIRGGPHRISMGSPENFKPRERRVTLRNTAPLRPKIVRFEKVDAAPPS